MIWIIALLLLGLVALTGFYRGAIQMGISLAGLLLAALLAVPLSPLARPIVGLGVKHSWGVQALAPVLVFLLIVIAFEITAALVHRKIDVFYKYKADDRRRLKWERLNRRLGASLGLVNGTFYFILVMVPIYVLGYLTVQMASGEETGTVRLVNRIRAELHESKLDRVLAAYDPAPETYYEAADILGLVSKNPLLVGRLARYPVFLSLAERPEFQDLASDVQLNDLFQRQATVNELLQHPRIQNIVTNPAVTTELTELIVPDLKDLRQYLETGKSAKYTERILGRWSLDIYATLQQERKRRSLSAVDLRRMRAAMEAVFAGSSFTATIDNKAILKMPDPAAPESPPRVMGEGSWKKEKGSFFVTLTANGKTDTVEALFEGDSRLLLARDGLALVFERDEI